jgi:hypothetical protein
MSATEGIALEQLRLLAERVGLHLSQTEVEGLKPMYDHYAKDVQALHELDLGMEDLAVVFPANWGTQG